MLRKTKSDASWNELSPEQRETLDNWLFENRLSYAKILLRAQKELGYRGQLTSLKRYFKRRQQERMLMDLDELGKDAQKVTRAKARSGTFRVANMRVFNGYLFRALRASPDDLDKLRPLLSLMVQNDRNDVLREIKDEEFEIRREAMAFAKEKFECDTMEKALRALPQLRELAEARKSPRRKQADEKARIKEIRLMMFGDEDEDEEEEDLQAPGSQGSENEQDSKGAT